ncbi:MAG: exopolyphosphatase [Casimicrobiaceae bacterium]
MPEHDTIAAVDLGSNSFHLQVVRIVGGQIYELDSLKESVRLAAGLDDDKRLSEPVQDAALACLHRFGERLHGFPPDAVRAVGTNALRVARNAGSFLGRARQALGFPIEIIAGREEARLIYLGVAHGLPASDENRLVVDIGGGSTECIVGNGLDPLHTESLYMGSVSYTQRYFQDGKITPARMQRAEYAARAELQTITSEFSTAGWTSAFGASGTARALGEMIFQNGLGERGITAEGLQGLRSLLTDAGEIRRLDIAGLSADRAAIIAGGLAIMSAVVEELQIESMELSPYALRHGVLFDLLGRAQHHDMRETTVEQFCQRYRVDMEQARRVESDALRLYAPIAQTLPEAQRAALTQRLRWAARLHEIGISIAYNGYHKHSAYIVQNADMPGFSKSDQAELALLVLAQRGSLGKTRSLVAGDDQWSLIAALRLATLLNRRRARRESAPLELSAGESGFTVRASAGWLTQHPLSATALEIEIDQWRAVNRAFVVEEY